MARPWRIALTAAIPLVLASVFVRLGWWQLDRLAERRAFNQLLGERMVAQPVSIQQVSRDTSAGHYRRVTAAGRLDYSRQIIYAGRSRHGSPGVYLITPMRIAGTDSLLLVNRGWVYSPDAGQVEESRWVERDSAEVTGYLETLAAGDAPPNARYPNRLHLLQRTAIERLVGRAVLPYVVVRTDTATTAVAADSIPARLELPALDEGPHLSYAFQWFAFATIAVVGGIFLVRTQR